MFLAFVIYFALMLFVVVSEWFCESCGCLAGDMGGGAGRGSLVALMMNYPC